ncbi:MAG: hypothetical protein L0177_11515, partial [Chloroflexi bacterium]|nr:hypothetical protein [Chloroflexota bacterium]
MRIGDHSRLSARVTVIS